MAEDFLTNLFSAAALELLKLRLVRSVIVPSPAAGAEIIVPVPGGVLWEFISLRTLLATSAVVANRIPSIVALDGDGNQQWRYPDVGTVTASQNATLTASAGIGYAGSPSVHVVGLPPAPAILIGGWSFRTSTSNIDAGDQYSGVAMLIREWDITGIMQEVEELDEQFQAYIALRAGR